MDSRITKKRLSEMLQYDWIKIIVTIVAAILVWELIFTTAGVRLTAGQQFKIYYYYTLSSGGADDVSDFIAEKVDFSYDVITRSTENLTSDYASTVLSARVTVAEGDIMFADNVITHYDKTDEGYESKTQDSRYDKSNMYALVDGYDFYDYQTLAKDARSYLESFKENGEFSDTLIEENFAKRMKKDNRFRKADKYAEGLAQEKERIYRLEKEVCAFEWLIENYKDTELFFKYTKYQYSCFYNGNEDYIEWYNQQSEGCYAINAGYLDKEEIRKDKKSITEIMCIASGDNVGKATDVAVMVFDFKKKQPDLQYETIVFLNAVIYNYSNIYDSTDFVEIWKN